LTTARDLSLTCCDAAAPNMEREPMGSIVNRTTVVRTRDVGPCMHAVLIRRSVLFTLSLLGAAMAFECRAQAPIAAPPTAETSAPDEAALRTIGEAAIKTQLLDPYSAVIDWYPQPFVAVTGITKGGLIFKRTVVSGDALVGCGTVNAKNRMGGYAGRVAFDVAIQNGQVVLAEMDSSDNDAPALVARFCQSLGFGAAPRTTPAPTAPPARVVFGAAFADVGPAIKNMLARPDLKGVVIVKVTPGSVASLGGLSEGDIITRFGGQVIGGSNDLLGAVRATEPGQLITVELIRGGKPMSLSFQF